MLSEAVSWQHRAIGREPVAADRQTPHNAVGLDTGMEDACYTPAARGLIYLLRSTSARIAEGRMLLLQ